MGYVPEDAEESSAVGTGKEGRGECRVEGWAGGSGGELAEEKTKVVVGFRTDTYEEGDFSIISGESCVCIIPGHAKAC